MVEYREIFYRILELNMFPLEKKTKKLEEQILVHFELIETTKLVYLKTLIYIPSVLFVFQHEITLKFRVGG